MSAPGPARRLRVVIDARLRDGESGGVQQTLVGLAHGLSQLEGEEEYLFLAMQQSCEWLRPHVHGPCSILPGPAWTDANAPLVRRLTRRLASSDWLRRRVERGALGRFVRVEVPRSDGTIERAGADVMHFALQAGFWTSTPSIYVPHDLQHAHHPEYFSPFELRWRAAHYGPLARQASAVVALSRWGRRDLVEHLHLPPEKIPVIGWAPAIDVARESEAVQATTERQRFELPDDFILYPAQTWRHKNHLRLLEALAVLRDRHGLTVHAVFTGRLNDFYPVIRRRVRALRLEAQTTFLGFVPDQILPSLYRAARVLAFPSEFEGFGMPLLEAFRAGLPAACSNAASLPELAGDAALIFEPGVVDSIAEAIHRLWTDGGLRERMADRGRQRVANSSWLEVARRYRALYRTLAGRLPSGEDAELLREIRS